MILLPHVHPLALSFTFYMLPIPHEISRTRVLTKARSTVHPKGEGLTIFSAVAQCCIMGFLIIYWLDHLLATGQHCLHPNMYMGLF